jgi:hypothetical protein
MKCWGGGSGLMWATLKCIKKKKRAHMNKIKEKRKRKEEG